jgi:Peptidase family M28
MRPAPSQPRVAVAVASAAALALVGVAACKPARPAAVDVPDRRAPAVAPAATATAATSPAVAPVAPAPATAAAAAPPAAPPPPPSCVDDGAPYAIDDLRARVSLLAAPKLDGRAPGTDGDRAARAHIVERFRCLGLTAGGAGGSYEQPFDDTANVIGLIPGSDPKVGAEIILVGAHHDHLGGGMLGANDNASGVAALLAVAQGVRRAGAPRRTIAFVTYGAEERGLVGSLHLVANPPPPLPLDKIVEVINLDMVGSHASANAVYAFGAFPKLPARAILAELARKYPKLNVPLGGHSVRGDHLGFCQQGIPYVFFWTPDRRCYHEKCDTADRLDYPRMADIAQLAGGLVQRLADTDVDLAAAKARAGCGAK